MDNGDVAQFLMQSAVLIMSTAVPMDTPANLEQENAAKGMILSHG